MLKLLRIDSARSIEGARQIFGVTFGVGIRNRAPKKGEPPRSIHYGDAANIVDVPPEQHLLLAERNKEFTFSQGVDFIYHERCRTLKIRVRYSRVEAENDLISRTLGLNPNQLINPNDRPVGQQSTITIMPGDFFIRFGELVQVVAVNGSEVIVSDDNGEQSNISINEAKCLLEDYLH